MSRPRSDLTEQVTALPNAPGVYLFKGNRGKVLYVGKAKSLRARVRQYLSGADDRLFVPFLLAAARHIDCVLVNTEKEALILENTLIKKHRPRYNVKLVDDSAFLHLAVNTQQKWPRYEVRRQVRRQPATRQFGPFASASRARATLEFVQRRFPLRTCSDRELKSRKRPCLLHQMGRCIAPCVDLCSEEEYDEVLTQSLMFLEGRNKELIARLKDNMAVQAEQLMYEAAAQTRDLIQAIESTVERQSMVDSRLTSQDMWGISTIEQRATVVLLPQRRGNIDEPFVFHCSIREGNVGEQLSSILNAWYSDQADIPPLILLSHEPEGLTALSEVLSDRRGQLVEVRVPQRGEKRRLVEIAVRNASAALGRADARRDERLAALQQLQKVCLLPHPPRRIECFDNSNIQGHDPVAAMAVFIDGEPSKGEYRRYKVKTVVGADDFASMAEILSRRIRRGLESGTLPDLIVIDGGKGQLSAVRRIFMQLGVADQRSPASVRATQPVVGLVGLAKPKTERRHGDREAVDKVFLPEAANPIRLPANSPALRTLQWIRDQTHDTAVSYHRRTRRRRTLTSALDDLPGVGPSRRRALLRHFGSAAAVRAASVEQLAEVAGFGPALAHRVRAALDQEPVT